MKPSDEKTNIYSSIMLKIFKEHFSPGVDSFVFDREEISEAAGELDIPVPKNLGDVVYSFRYRNDLPKDITSAATEGRFVHIHKTHPRYSNVPSHSPK